jgi:hypothetical protein
MTFSSCKPGRLSRGAVTMLLAASTAGTAVLVAPAAAAAEPAAAAAEPDAADPAAPAPVCQDANTVSVLSAFDQIVAETRVGIPAQLQPLFTTNVDNLRAALQTSRVAYVDVSRDASEINDTAEENDDHYANFAVARLDKIRNGEADATVAFKDLSLSEVVETLVLGMYSFTIPLDVAARSMPSIAPIPGAEALAGTPLIGGYLTIGYLAKLPLQYGSQGIRQLADNLQGNLTSGCYTGDAAPADGDRLTHGGAAPVIPVQPAEQGNADYLALGDPATCTTGDAETLGAALDRVAEGMRGQVPAGQEGAFDAEVARLKGNAQTARVTNNFIMKDPEDLNPIVAMIDNPMVTLGWGAVQGAFDGTAGQSTAVADLTVGNGIDYATVAEALTSLLAGNVWGSATESTNTTVDVGNLFNPDAVPAPKQYTVLPDVTAAASYLTTESLDVYDHTLQSLCIAGTEGAGDAEGAGAGE